MATLPIFAPDGSLGDIPHDQLPDALKAGYIPAVPMLHPSGQQGYVPANQIAQAFKAGYKHTGGNPAQEAHLAGSQPLEMDSGNAVSRGLTTIAAQAMPIVGSMAAGLAPGVIQSLADLPANLATAGRSQGSADPQAGIVEKIASGAIQGLGGDPKAIAEAAKNRDFPQIAAESVTPIVTALAAKRAAGSLEGIGSAQNPIGPVEAADQLTNAVNPPAKLMPKMRADFAKHIDDIVNSGVKISGHASLAKAVQAAGKSAQIDFQNMLDPIAHEAIEGPPNSTGGPTLGQSYKRLVDINGMLAPKYDAGGGLIPTLSTESAQALSNEAAELAPKIYSRMGQRLNLDPQKIAEMNARAGGLRDLGKRVQTALDETRFKENAAKNAPVDLKTEFAGLAARGVNETYRYFAGGNPAQRAIRNALVRLRPGETTILNPRQSPSEPAPLPRTPYTTGAESSDVTTFNAEPDASAQAGQIGSLNYRANVNAQRARNLAISEAIQKSNTRAAHPNYKPKP